MPVILHSCYTDCRCCSPLRKPWKTKTKHLFHHHHHYTLPLLCTPETQATKKSPDRNEQRMNSSSERLLHHTDLTIVTQTTMTMLLDAFRSSTDTTKKSLCTATEFNVFILPKNHEAYLSNISETQGFHSLQIRTQKSDSMRTLRETLVTIMPAAIRKLIRQSIKEYKTGPCTQKNLDHIRSSSFQRSSTEQASFFTAGAKAHRSS